MHHQQGQTQRNTKNVVVEQSPLPPLPRARRKRIFGRWFPGQRLLFGISRLLQHAPKVGVGILTSPPLSHGVKKGKPVKIKKNNLARSSIRK